MALPQAPRLNTDGNGLHRIEQAALRPKASKARPKTSLANLNRGGRPKGSSNKVHAEIAMFARQYGPECIANLVTIMRGAMQADVIDADVVIRCSDLLLQRGYGRPATAVNIGGPDGEPLDFRGLSDDRLADLLLRLDAFIEGEGDQAAAGDPSGVGQAQVEGV